MSISVVILAAGQGTRMKSLTPKVLHKISGKSMLFHSIDASQKLSDDVTVVLYHQASLIEDEINSHYKGIKFHHQDAENFPGTGGAMRGVKVKHSLTLILNGDMPLVTMSALNQLIEGDSDINLSVIDMPTPTGYGRVVIEDKRVLEIVEEKDCSLAQKSITSVNAGVYCIKSALLDKYIPMIDNCNAQKEYYLTDIIKLAVDNGNVIAPIFVKEEEFKGVNSKLDLSKAEEIHQRRIKEAWMMKGVIMSLPETIFVDSRVEFEGECVVESGVSIRGNSTIISSHIKSNSVIEDAYIESSDIGPLARIRPLSRIIDTHIGNFVEVKKSTLTGVKAGHLAYIGDAVIDKGSNIGAGVITCNYDGKNKYQTIIGKNVFVGSDTQLVAPVKIEDDVMIGAGSTITKDVAKGSLALSRVPMKTIKNFFYKFFGEK
ncbi:MAG: bifunctional UDP-N-acetylglucosamine diphosphorylase/glucosamine-1-phosphate N-acetyltransferase GlmU [Sulfurovum sp.]